MAAASELAEQYPDMAGDDFLVQDEDTPTVHIKLPDDRNLERVLNQVKLRGETEKFMISINDKPVFYVDHEELARQKLWALSKLLITKKTKDENFQYYIKTDGNELQVTCLNKFYMIAYDTVAYRIRYDKVLQCKF